MSSSRSSSFDILVFLLVILAMVVGLMAIWKIRFEKARSTKADPAKTVSVQKMP